MAASRVQLIKTKTPQPPAPMETFTPVSSLIGGSLIGLAVSLLLVANGRIAGISGIVGGALSVKVGDLAWRIAFVLGLLSGGITLYAARPDLFAVTIERSVLAVVTAGLLVGFGTRLGSGCTSGHGVCGVSRLSPRSIVATLTFIATGTLMAFVVTQLFGGSI
jgi:uncharacterized membrane protein YedE/YeeE